MNRIEKIDKKIKELLNEKRILQAMCPHPPSVVRYQYGASTGNYDRGADCYWTNLRCTLCEKRWVVEGSISPGVGSIRVEDGVEL